MELNLTKIISKYSIESKISHNKIEELCGMIAETLRKEGCLVDDPRFIHYLVRRLRKRLKLSDANTLKTFKNFFKEN